MITADNLAYGLCLAVESLEELIAHLAVTIQNGNNLDEISQELRGRASIISMQLSALADDTDTIVMNDDNLVRYQSHMRKFYPIAFTDNTTKKPKSIKLQPKEKKHGKSL